MVQLGSCYLEGRGVGVEEAVAAGWFSVASNLGCAKATYQLARCYAKGLGVPQDNGEFERLLRSAVEAGDAEAQYRLFLNIFLGAMLGTRDEGETLLRRAAEGGFPEAMLVLGMRCVRFRENIDEAKEWFRKAASAGNQDAVGYMGLLHLNGPFLDVRKSVDDMVKGVTLGTRQGVMELLKDHLRRFQAV
jgi:TPR repeat protein